MTTKAMGTIQGIVGILLLGLMAGCSMRKQSTGERTAWHTRAAEVANEERQLRRHERATARSIQLEYAGSIAEIIPAGTFRLSADSGYVGRAERVVIHRDSGSLRVAESGAVVSAVDSAATMAATREYTAVQRDTRMRQREAAVSPLLEIPWWVWLCIAGGVLYLTRRLWMK